ncbi:type I glyceraldehyde-3-phosphate dehydrogenase [Candidatus Parcubacteria bacterium]|jgi:glyceraldehyde 3-phosphate dehydrogenase|nr:MAG: type I glyceraldehyde-3-phosphate dehydrogenase [Candidatus Parcubacteria bacterium]
MKNIAINGFGRIGRLFLRSALQNASMNVVAINDLGDIENLAYLFTYDSVYGKYKGSVSVEGNVIIIDGKKIQFLQERDATKLPWGQMNIDVVLECTGVFESFEKANVHILSGAKHVILSAPAKDEDGVCDGKTILMGINDSEITAHPITSNASCTTNASAPVIQIMNESVGVEKAVLNTVHAYTATQNIVDGPTKGKDYRRGRAGAFNISPSTTGAALAVSRVITELGGKFDGVAMRVPTISGSAADITFISKRPTSVEEINTILRDAAKSDRWNNTFTVTEDQLVSSDIIGMPYGAVVDLGFTKVVDGTLVKILSWYDNEAGYVSTLLKHTQKALGI